MYDVTLIIKAESERCTMEYLKAHQIDARLVDFDKKRSNAVCLARLDSVLPVMSWYGEDIMAPGEPCPFGGLLWFKYE